jgi:hypothetical protein
MKTLLELPPAAMIAPKANEKALSECHASHVLSTETCPKVHAKIASIRFFIYVNNHWLT